MIIEDIVNAAGDPFGVEDVGILEAKIILVVEDNSKIVEKAD
jgi:hypothetical protein